MLPVEEQKETMEQDEQVPAPELDNNGTSQDDSASDMTKDDTERSEVPGSALRKSKNESGDI